MISKEKSKRTLALAVLITVGIATGIYWFWRDQQTKSIHYELLAAATSGDVSKAAELIRRGAPVSARFGGDGDTALHRAAAYGHVDLVRLLLQAGAYVNAVDADGATPLLAAAYHGHLAVVKILVEAGANINAQETRHGFTPLQEAARKGHVEVVRLLLVKGADVNLKTKDGRTALTRAQTEGHHAIESELKQAGARK